MVQENQCGDKCRISNHLVLHAPETISEVEREQYGTPDSEPECQHPQHYIELPGSEIFCQRSAKAKKANHPGPMRRRRQRTPHIEGCCLDSNTLTGSINIDIS